MKRQNGTETSAFGTNGRINHDSSKFYNSKLYTELGDKKVLDKNENDFPDKLENKFILGSAENMKELPDNSVHLMITSPPYNVSKEYDEDLSLGKPLYEAIADIVKEYKYPVCFDFPVGHVAQNMAIVNGAPVELTVTSKVVELKF